MRVQLILVGGPFDMHLASYSAIDKFPAEIRVASGDRTAASVEAAVYRKIEVVEMPASLLWYGNYEFVGMRSSTPALIDMWIEKGDT